MDYRALVQKLGDRTNQNTQTSELILEHRTGHPTYLNKHNKTIVLLDYNTNCDINNLSSPLSHASLIKEFVESSILPEDFVFSQEWVDKHSVK